jgi:hypothetical protein
MTMLSIASAPTAFAGTVADGGAADVPKPLGWGFDLVRGETAAARCVDFAEPAQQSGGQKVVFEVQITSELDALMRQLDFSPAEWINGLGSNDARMKFLHEQATGLRQVRALAAAHVRNAPLIAGLPRLADDAAALLRTDAARFRARCGDGFIAGIETGGAVIAQLLIEVSAASDAVSVVKSLGLSDGNWTAGWQAAATQAGSRAHLSIYSDGASGSVVCDSVQCLVDRVHELPTVVAGANASMVKPLVVSYEHLALPDDAQPLVSVIDALSEERLMVAFDQRLSQLIGRANDALAAPSAYAAFDAAALQRAVDATARDLLTLRQSETSCFADPHTCVMPALHAAPLVPPPLR